jgi:hypothetical protein
VNSSNYLVRRATLEDLGPLTELWKSMRFPVEDLGKRITEFQIAQNAEGGLLGAVGLQVAGRQGLIHHEGYTDFGLADQLRPLFWDRIRAVSNNHGLFRLWSEEQAPFWRHCGLGKADAEALEKLPAVWRNHPSELWTLKLKEDIEAVVAADPELALLMEAEKQRTGRILQQARIMKTLATLVAVAVFIMVLAAAIYLVHKNPQLLRR